MKININVRTGLGLLISLMLIFFMVHNSSSLTLCAQNVHFKIYCAKEDENVSQELLPPLEDLYEQLTKDFQHTYSGLISIEIYPNLTEFHKAIHAPFAPDWLVAEANPHIVKGVSPSNPGPAHSHESMVSCYKVCLAHLFLMDSNDHYKNAPYWLLQGVSLYKGNRHKKIQGQVPTMAQLDAIKDCAINFDKINGFSISPLLVKFIDINWGWDTVLKLLENYSDFENIIGFTKEEFMSKFKKSLAF